MFNFSYLSTQIHLFGMQYYVENNMEEIKSSAPVRNHKNQKNI